MIKEFAVGEKVIYPSYGLGEIVDIESQTMYGIETKVYVISFDQGKMVLKVPIQKSDMLRIPMKSKDISTFYEILRQPPEATRSGIKTNQIYETRIKSGDLYLMAKTVRDIYKKNAVVIKPQSSYSYNQKRILDSAIKWMAEEVAQIESMTVESARDKIIEMLNS